MRLRRSPFNAWCVAFGVVGLAGAAWRPMEAPATTILISGDIQGYLSPCGCTSPMTGGIRRLATLVASTRGKNGIFLVNGGLIDPQPPNGRVGVRQNELKAETLAEAFRVMNADAINVGSEEVSGGQSMLIELSQLAEGRIISTSLGESATNKLPRWIVRGSLLVGGVTPAAEMLASTQEETPVAPDVATRDLVDEAARLGKTPILMFRGGLDDARVLAKAFPALALVIYKSAGTAPAEPVREGNTLLVTPGDHTKNLVRVELDGGKLSAYHVDTLTPEFADEHGVSKLYADYLHRVTKAQLIEGLARSKGPAFAGSKACMTCHPAAYSVWHASSHAHALRDLELQGHARDPDCLACHVTGLESIAGFLNRSKTPKLADVTCESCHGPSAAHAKMPKQYRLPKLGAKSCLKCHGSENSPGFNFETYWPKISHR